MMITKTKKVLQHLLNQDCTIKETAVHTQISLTGYAGLI